MHVGAIVQPGSASSTSPALPPPPASDPVSPRLLMPAMVWVTIGQRRTKLLLYLRGKCLLRQLLRQRIGTVIEIGELQIVALQQASQSWARSGSR